MNRRHASSVLAIGASAALALLATPCPALAQLPSAATAKALQGDFAVPDAPALLMLGIAQSKLLRPGSVQQLTSNLTSAAGDFNMIPRAFAVEFSPAMLLRGPSLGIAEYQANSMLYRTRLSFGANRDSTNGRSLIAFGLRMSLDDQADLRTNPAFLVAIGTLTAMKVDSARAVLAELSARGIPRVGTLTPAQQQAKDSIIAAVAKAHQEALRLADSLQVAGADMANAVAAVKRAKEAALWNASVADIAVAFRGSAADSVGRQARFDGVAGWATKGVKLGDISQLLVGFRGAYERDTTAKAALRGTGDVVARLYVGSNTYKVSFEGQGTGRASSQPKWLFRVGGEFEAAKTIWVEFGAGWQATGRLDGGTLTHSVTFHLAPPNQ